jgi:hypothetical protein
LTLTIHQEPHLLLGDSWCFELRALCLLDKHSTIWTIHPALLT